MEITSAAVAKSRWRIMLPVVMSVLSASLMLLAKKQQPILRKAGTGWEVPARVVNSLINGPGFYLGRLIPIPIPNPLNETFSFDADRLSGIVVFWFVIGLSIDRRRNKQALDRWRPALAAVLFTLAAVSCGALGFTRIVYVFCPNPILVPCDNPHVVWMALRLVAKYPLRTWSTMGLGLGVWFLVLSAYFARRAFVAGRRNFAPAAAGGLH